MVLHEQDILWLNISMKNTISMHVIDCLQKLVHVVLDAIFGQVVSFAFDCIIHIHVHQLKHKRQPSRRLITIKNK